MFKTAQDLQITEDEHSALIKVMGRMERGELIDHPDVCDIIPNGFNMTTTGTSCGTTACIGGWVAAEMRFVRKQSLYVHHLRSEALFDLYWNLEAVEREANVATAALAIRNFLTTGEARWEELLAA